MTDIPRHCRWDWVERMQERLDMERERANVEWLRVVGALFPEFVAGSCR